MVKKPATSSFWVELFGFLRSRNGLILMALIFLYLGVVNLDQIKELLEAVKGLFG